MISIFKAEERHLDGVLKIENECFSPPWSRESFMAEISARNGYFMVAEITGEVVGFCVFRYFENEGEVFNIAVSEEHRREGVGTLLLLAMLDFAKRHRVERIFLEVRESNVAAIHMYGKYGFSRYGVRQGYYDEPKENAVLMRRDAVR